MSKEVLDGTIIVEATGDADDLRRRLEAISSSATVLVVSVESGADTAEILGKVTTDKIAFLPAGALYDTPPFDRLKNDIQLAPWILDRSLDPRRQQIGTSRSLSWLATTELLRELLNLRFPSEWTIFNLDSRLREAGRTVIWSSARRAYPAEPPAPVTGKAASITTRSSVLALIPHYQAGEWLASCLASLVSQTRPLDGIVVIDDASPEPPIEIVRRFPQVTLFAAEKTVGPFCLKQEIVDTTTYDAYLFQDADDWSTNDRLELLLNEAERTGAELVGSQEVRIYSDARGTVPVTYPLDASWSSCEDPVLHPTTIVSRSLLQRVGGFATGLRFGGDVEFQIRASCVARMANVAGFCYFRRRHSDSLTMAPKTGIGSPARRELQEMLKQQAAERARMRALGQVPNLRPSPVAKRVTLKHVLGPTLKGH